MHCPCWNRPTIRQWGAGRVGTLPKPSTLQALIEQAAQCRRRHGAAPRRALPTSRFPKSHSLAEVAVVFSPPPNARMRRLDHRRGDLSHLSGSRIAGHRFGIVGALLERAIRDGAVGGTTVHPAKRTDHLAEQVGARPNRTDFSVTADRIAMMSRRRQCGRDGFPARFKNNARCKNKQTRGSQRVDCVETQTAAVSRTGHQARYGTGHRRGVPP